MFAELLKWFNPSSSPYYAGQQCLLTQGLSQEWSVCNTETDWVTVLFYGIPHCPSHSSFPVTAAYALCYFSFFLVDAVVAEQTPEKCVLNGILTAGTWLYFNMGADLSYALQWGLNFLEKIDQMKVPAGYTAC